MANDNSTGATDALLPTALIALVLFLSLAFQTMQTIRDRDALNQYVGEQNKPLEESHKLQDQLAALALGTKKLAEGGDKNAATIITHLQQMGINIDISAPNASSDKTAPTSTQP